METIKQNRFLEERALFGAKDLTVEDSVFESGESPLKESAGVVLKGCSFKYKYPLWYAHDITAERCLWFEMARAGVWYSDRIFLNDCVIDAPKNFRRCRDLSLKNVSFSNAAETLWNCSGVTLDQVTVRGDYFAMNSSGLTVDGLTLYGNYAFDGCRDLTVKNSTLMTKDAFWNTENVTVTDSYIAGEYLGWNSKNLTLVNCTVESLQGMCYIDGLVMKNCKLLNTTLAFEYSRVEADITSRIDSVFNPSEGSIQAPEIGELILQDDQVDPEKTKILCENIGKTSREVTWD